MNIRHECPMPDLSYAVAAPLMVQVKCGKILTVKRWSLEGLWIDAQGYDLSSDTILAVPFQGVDISFPVKLTKAEKPDLWTFQNLTVRQRETLGVFYKGMLSGRMASTQDVITSLDTPVDLVPMGETEEEKNEGLENVKPRSLRILWNVLFYVFAALFLGVFVGGKIWDRLSHVPLDHGRFVAPMLEYTAPSSGYVGRIDVRVGETVRKGDVIAKLIDPDRESDVEEVRSEVLTASSRLEQAQELVDRHKADRDRYRRVVWQKFNSLWSPLGFPNRSLIHHLPNIRPSYEALLRFDADEDVTPGGYHSILAELQRDVERLDLDLRRWKRELRHRKSAANELVVRAKEDGTVFEIHTRRNAFIGRGELIAEVENDSVRTAVGWLDDRLAPTVYIGMPAEVRYSERGRSKRVAGTIVDLQAGTDTVQPDKYGMIVTVAANELDLETSRSWFRRNAPASIKLHRSPMLWLRSGDEDASS